MSIVITDPTLVLQFSHAGEPMEVRDANGNLLGTFAPPYGKLPPGVRSPYSDAEVEELRKQPDGRPLAEILQDLAKRA